MDMSERSKPVITEAASLRLVYSPNAAKKIAREFGVAVATAKVWLAGRFPVARRDELAQRINAELDRQEAKRVEIRRQWALGGGGEKDRALDSGRPHLARPQADRLGRKVSR